MASALKVSNPDASLRIAASGMIIWFGSVFIGKIRRKHPIKEKRVDPGDESEADGDPYKQSSVKYLRARCRQGKIKRNHVYSQYTQGRRKIFGSYEKCLYPQVLQCILKCRDDRKREHSRDRDNNGQNQDQIVNRRCRIDAAGTEHADISGKNDDKDYHDSPGNCGLPKILPEAAYKIAEQKRISVLEPAQERIVHRSIRRAECNNGDAAQEE